MTSTPRVALIVSALAILPLSGCYVPPSTSGMYGYSDSPPAVLADDDPRFADRYGLGDEYELTRRVQITQSRGAIGLRALYPRSEKNGNFLGYLPPGTRLRVEHVWFVPPESPTPHISGATVTMRVLPDHDPLPLPLSPADVSGGWEQMPGGERGNVYVLSPTHYRRVSPDERTPEDKIEPLTEKQEWPEGSQR
jgi:hypothetical protein